MRTFVSDKSARADRHRQLTPLVSLRSGVKEICSGVAETSYSKHAERLSDFSLEWAPSREVFPRGLGGPRLNAEQQPFPRVNRRFKAGRPGRKEGVDSLYQELDLRLPTSEA